MVQLFFEIQAVGQEAEVVAKAYCLFGEAVKQDDEYYQYAVVHSREIEGIQAFDKEALIVLKAKAI